MLLEPVETVGTGILDCGDHDETTCDFMPNGGTIVPFQPTKMSEIPTTEPTQRFLADRPEQPTSPAHGHQPSIDVGQTRQNKLAEEAERREQLPAIDRKIQGQGFSVESREQDVEGRIRALNKRMQSLRNSIPPVVLKNSDQARWLAETTFDIKDGKSCFIVTRRGDARILEDPRFLRFMRLLAPEADLAVDGDSLITYLPIEKLESDMDRMESKWSTAEVTETEEKKNQFDSKLLHAKQQETGPLLDALVPTQKLKDIMSKAPQGMEKTVWGKMVSASTFRTNAGGDMFLVIPEDRAKEFRKVGEVMFDYLQSKTIKLPQGGYAVRLNQVDMDEFFREVAMANAPDQTPFLLHDPIVQNALKKFLSPEERQELMERAEVRVGIRVLANTREVGRSSQLPPGRG